MLNCHCLLEISIVQIISEIFNGENLILSVAHIDGRWPIEFVFF